MEGEAELLRQLDQIHVGKQKVLSLQKDSIELEIGKLAGCCEFAENVLKFGGEVDVLNMKSRLEALNELKVHFIKGELNPKIEFSLFEHLGIVKQLYEVFFKVLEEQFKLFDVL